MGMRQKRIRGKANNMDRDHLHALLPLPGEKKGNPPTRPHYQSRTKDWFAWLVWQDWHYTDALCLDLPPLPLDIASCFPPQSSGPLWLDDFRVSLNLLVVADVWCRVARIYFRLHEGKRGVWMAEDEEISREAVLFSSTEFALALVMISPMRHAPLTLANRIIKAAVAKASPANLPEENHLLQWVHHNLSGYNKEPGDPLAKIRAAQWLTSVELLEAYISDSGEPLSARALSMKLNDAIRVVFRSEITSGYITRSKNLCGHKRGWLGLFWTSWSRHHPHQHDEREAGFNPEHAKKVA